MEKIIQQLKISIKPLALYAITKMVIMWSMFRLFELVELTEIVDVNKITMCPTMTELISVYNNYQSVPVILARSLLNISYSEYIASFETLYVLYKFVDLPIVFGLQYSWFYLMKYLAKQVLVWVWSMNETEWPALFNNPNSIRTTLTLEQIDALEFEITNMKNKINTHKGKMNENEWTARFNNPNSIYATLTLQEIDALEFGRTNIKRTMLLFGGMILGTVNGVRIFEAMKQWLFH